MANVIPMQVRQATRKELQARFMIAGALVAIVAALAALIIFLPSYLALASGGSSSDASGAALSAQQEKDDAAQVKHVGLLLRVVAPIFAASSSPTSVISEAISLKPKEIHIDQILYSTGKQGSILLSGSADSESAISDYRTALLGDPRFTSVSVPVGVLVGTDAGRFSITITGKF